MCPVVAFTGLALIVSGHSCVLSAAPADKPVSFEETAEAAIDLARRIHKSEGIAPGLELFSLPLKEKVAFSTYSEELKAALHSRDAKYRLAATSYLIQLGALVHWEDSKRKTDDRLIRALGQHLSSIKSALEEIIKEESGREEYLYAAALLLGIDSGHAKAAEIVAGNLTSQTGRRRVKACELAEMLRLSSGKIVDGLAAALVAKDEHVRQSAARAVWKLGHKAKKAVPVLIELVKSGKHVYGAVFPFEYPKNIILLALGEMGADARPAVSSLVENHTLANQGDRAEIYTCLAVLGPHAIDALSLLRQSLARGTDIDRIIVAATLLCIDHNDSKAAKHLLMALESHDKEKRDLSLQVCRDLSPRAKELIPSLVKAAQERKDSYGQLCAIVALGRMGIMSDAATMVLERLVVEDFENINTAFPAAIALGRLGKTGTAALTRMLRSRNSLVRQLAALAFGESAWEGDEPLRLLIAGLQDEDVSVRAFSAISLGRQRWNNDKAIDLLSRLSKNDPDLTVRIVATWALTQLGPVWSK